MQCDGSRARRETGMHVTLLVSLIIVDGASCHYLINVQVIVANQAGVLICVAITHAAIAYLLMFVCSTTYTG